MAGLFKIGALYEGTDKEGNQMLNGNIDLPAPLVIDGTNRLVILVNPRKTAENHPDFEVFVTKNEPQGG